MTEFSNVIRWPKKSMMEQVLDKHNVYAKAYANQETGESYCFLVSKSDSIYDAIASINEGEDGANHYSGSIKGNNGESLRELIIRLGWVKKNEEGKYEIV